MLEKNSKLVHTSYIICTSLLFSFPVILSARIRGPFLILWSLFTLYLIYSRINFGYSNTHVKSEGLALKASLLFSLFLLISLLRSTDIKDAWFSVERMLPLIFIPVLAYFSPYRFSKEDQILFFKTFIISCLLLLIYLAGTFLYYHNPSFQWDNVLIATTHFRHLVGFVIVSVHPTYQAIWFFFAAILTIYVGLYRKEKSVVLLIVVIFTVLAFVNWAVALAARTPLIAFGLTCIGLIFISQFSTKAKLISLAVLLIVASSSILFLPTIRSRVYEVVYTEISPPVESNANSTNLRVVILHCSLESIRQNWLLGVGIGDAQDVLNNCYQAYNIDEFSNNDYNSHNQYLHIWLIAGTLGGLSFLFLLASIFFISLKHWNIPLLAFMAFISLCFLTENVLVRNHGVVLFALMISVVGIGSRKFVSTDNGPSSTSSLP